MFRRCGHPDIRCIHGDEINTTRKFFSGKIARVRCLICKRALYRVELPAVCWYTGKPHSPLSWRQQGEEAVS